MNSTVTLPAYALWVPVIAALGSALLTGLVAFGVNGLQHRRERRASARKELAAAYNGLLVGCLLQVRPAEGPSVFLGLRSPFDPTDVFNRTLTAFQPINEAWTLSQSMFVP